MRLSRAGRAAVRDGSEGEPEGWDFSYPGFTGWQPLPPQPVAEEPVPGPATPAAPTPPPATPTTSRRSTLLFGVLGALAMIVVALVVALFLLVPSKRSPTTTPVSGPVTSTSTTGSPGPTFTVVAPTPVTVPPSTKPSTTAVPTSTSSVVDGVPIGSGEDSANTWVAQLGSIPVGDDADLARVYQGIVSDIPTARVLSSSEFASLRPGYWFIYEPGPYANGVAAVAFCAQHGRTDPNSCVGRYLSHDTSDTIQCVPNPGGEPTGRCND